MDSSKTPGGSLRAPIRNIGILAHIDAGKTSITERILHVTGVREKAGNVDDGTTTTDYLTVERQHGITIKTAAVRFVHKGVLFNLLDTPGHVDFSAEVDRVLRVLDGAVIILCAVSGVQVRTGFIATGCRAHHIPRIYFINKMDRRGADFFSAVKEIAGELGEPVLPLQIPTFEDYHWNGIVDLIDMSWYPVLSNEEENESENKGDKIATASSEHHFPIENAPITEEMRRFALESREKLLDRVSMYDDSLMEKLISGRTVSEKEIRSALIAPIWKQEVTPILCGSSFSDISSRLLMDAIIDYLPDPYSRGCPPAKDMKTGKEIRLEAKPDAPFSAYIFKTAFDADLNTLAWIRLWSGQLREGMKVMAMPFKKIAQMKHLYGINGAEIEKIDSAAAGEIVGACLSYMEAGSTLCETHLQLVYESFKNPEPLVSIALEPTSQQDLPRLRNALKRFSLEDAGLLIDEEKETGRITIAGQGELHLDIVLERLQEEYGLRVRAGNPQVPKVERLMKPVHIEEEFTGDFGGEKLSVTLGISLENQKDKDENKVIFAQGLRLLANFEAALHRAAETSLAVGPSGGWPIIGARLIIERITAPMGGDRRAETAVEVATSAILRKAVSLAGSYILVPIVQVSVEVPDAWFGAALASLQARGARIEAVEDEGVVKSIIAYAPMENFFGYTTSLRSITEGRGIYQAKFDHYGNMNEY
ncbi:MAG: GTP-binding protein [Rectinema sp.]